MKAETFYKLKSKVENLFTGEIINETDYYLFPRAENNDITMDMLYSQKIDDDGNRIRLENSLTIGTKDSNHNTLTSSIAVFNESQKKAGETVIPEKFSLDGLVLPDQSVYKGWAGSKITVTPQTNSETGKNEFVVTESLGTKMINGVINLGRSFLNNFRTEENQKDLYGYYTASEINTMKEAQIQKTGSLYPHSITAWTTEKNVPENYYNQGCTK